MVIINIESCGIEAITLQRLKAATLSFVIETISEHPVSTQRLETFGSASQILPRKTSFIVWM